MFNAANNCRNFAHLAHLLIAPGTAPKICRTTLFVIEEDASVQTPVAWHQTSSGVFRTWRCRNKASMVLNEEQAEPEDDFRHVIQVLAGETSLGRPTLAIPMYRCVTLQSCSIIPP